MSTVVKLATTLAALAPKTNDRPRKVETMTQRKGRTMLRRLAAALALAAGLSGLSVLGAQTAQAADAHFVLISHAPDSDSWWNTIKNAIKQADEDFNVETDYRNPPNGDIADMARLIEQAAARNYDGVITTIADWARSCTWASPSTSRVTRPAKRPRPQA